MSRRPLPAARLRAQGGLLEVGADDLAMDDEEAVALLVEAGVELPDADLRAVVRTTEGWPVGLYLAALAVTAGARHRDIGVTFTGDDRFMGDYLRAELLDRVSPADVSFLTRTAILEQMSGPLCDAVVGGTRSSAILERLEGRNLLVVPLDRRREWYRYHHLFRELLLAELRRREPGMLVELHLRAAAWCEANGLPESADRPRPGRGRRRPGRSPRPAARQPGLGQRALRHRDALDGVVRGRGSRRSLPGDRRARRGDVRLGRQAGWYRGVGQLPLSRRP